MVTEWAVDVNLPKETRFSEKIGYVDETEVYAAIGEEGFTRLVSAFYRQVPGDDILGPMYPAADLAGAEERLRQFLMFRFGGSMQYVETRGHPRLRMRHAPFLVNQNARDRWLQLMRNALNEVALPEEAAKVLYTFFDSTSTFLINRA
jgi:hemoglobin